MDATEPVGPASNEADPDDPIVRLDAMPMPQARTTCKGGRSRAWCDRDEDEYCMDCDQ